MKKTILLLISLLYINLHSIAQSTFIEQYYTFNTGSQLIYSTVLQNSALYSAGYTSAFGSGLTDALLLKTDLEGDTIWAKSFGGKYDECVKKIKLLHDGNLLMVGFTTSFSNTNSDTNIFITKVDTSGNLLWSKTIGGSVTEKAVDFYENTDGSIIVLGNTTSMGAGGIDVFLVKISSTGNFMWSKSLGGTSDDIATSIIKHSSTKYIISGHTKSFTTIGFHPFILVVDTAGKFILAKEYDSHAYSTPKCYGNCIIKGLSNNFILVGKNGTGGVGDAQPFALSLDSLGTVKWSYIYTINSGDCSANSVIATSDNNYLVAGVEGNYISLLFKISITGQPIWSNNYSAGVAQVECVETSKAYISTGISMQNQPMLIKTDKGGVIASCSNSTFFNGNTSTPTTTSITFSADSASYNTIDSCFATKGSLPKNEVCYIAAIKQHATNNILNIYPNPAQNNFIVELTDNQKQTLQLFDVTGKQVLAQTINGTSSIDVSSLDNGIYFIQLKNGVSVSTKKIIVQH